MPRTPRVVRRKGRALVVGTAGHTTSVSLRPVSSARLSFGRAHTPLRSTPPGLDGVFPACFVLLLMLLFDEARRVRSARIAAAGATGPAILGNRPLPSAAIGVIAPLARALLAGLVISDILGPNWSSADGPLALGIVIAAASRTTGLPAPAFIIAAVGITAVTRAAL